MKKIMNLCLSFFMVVSMMMISPIKAAGSMLPTAQDNLNVRLKSTSELVATSNGYMRVFYDGKTVRIEYYDNNFNIQSKKSIAMELSTWGGFYAGSNAYYLVEGQANKSESDTAEVIRVIKYDTNWNKKGTAKITGNPDLFGGEVRYPFDNGCVEMTEYNGTLYIVTGHEGYVDPAYNQGHQGFLMIAVDEASMTGEIVVSDLWHSFAQYIANKEKDLYVLEQSEGSRYTKLSKYDANSLKGNSFAVLNYGGSRDSAWAIPCYASVDGMALSSSNVLCLGTSIDQSNYDSVTSDTAHNIYLTVTPMTNFSEDATKVTWLTNYSGAGKCFLGTKIVKIHDNRFMVSWEEYDTSQAASTGDTLSGSVLHYVFIDGNGNKISKEFKAAASISDCQPIVKGNKIVYYASNANMVDFYTIDASTGSFSKKGYRVAGENVTWNLSNGVLTLSGSGAISVDTKANYRYPVSSTRNSFSYSSSDNAWKPVRDKVKKIVIRKGITSIPKSSFEYYNELSEVQIESGVKSIGEKAFYGCNKLRKITIPASVTSIGTDFLWTGYYWTYDESHVVRATIYAPLHSYAADYAKKNGIACQINLSGASVKGLKASYVYNGKQQKPTVSIAGLKQGTDYTVAYSNNVNVGTATVTITGKGSYTGSVKKTFAITKASYSVTAKNYSGTYDGKAHGISLSNVKSGSSISYSKDNKNWTTTKPTRTAAGTTTVYYRITNPNYKTITGSKKITISKRNVSKLTYSKISNKTYTGKQIKPGVTVKYGKKTLKNKTDYTLSYGKNKATGKATVKITGKGNYTGSVTKTFYIVPKKVTLSSVKAGKKSATIKYKKVTGASGYQIAYSTNKKKGFKYVYVNSKTASKTIKKLKSRKTYYFKVRAYKTVGKTKYYGAYSSLKSTKIK